MADQSSQRDHLGTVVHRFLEHLTALRIRAGSVRRRVRRGTIAPAELEARLIQIEQDIDATAALAKDVRAESSSSP